MHGALDAELSEALTVASDNNESLMETDRVRGQHSPGRVTLADAQPSLPHGLVLPAPRPARQPLKRHGLVDAKVQTSEEDAMLAALVEEASVGAEQGPDAPPMQKRMAAVARAAEVLQVCVCGGGLGLRTACTG